MAANEAPKSARHTALVPFAWVILLGIVIAWVSCACYHDLPAKKDADGFSSDNAKQHLIGLVDQRPRVIGTDRHQQSREFIVRQLQDWGYEVELQTGNSVVRPRLQKRSESRAEVELTNILAAKSLDPSDTKKLLLVAHYDSVPFGPGASDNGVGVAAMLEVAKLIQDQTIEQRDILFLFSDGEELGLLGAQLFASNHRLMDEIGLVINVDARGTQGPSLMFETGPDTGRLIPFFANASHRPYASSLFGEIYKRLPNDTDFSVFKRRQLHGFNFAFIGNVRNYHTPADNLENVSETSLQHHGENIYELVKALSDRSADSLFEKGTAPAPKRVVYFDLLGIKLFWWSETNARLASCLCLLVWLLSATWLVTRPPDWATEGSGAERESGGRGVRSLLSLLAQSVGTLLAVGLSVGGVLWLIGRDARLGAPWPDGALSIHIALWLVGLSTVCGVSSCFTSTNDRGSLTQLGLTTGGWAGLLILTAFWGTGASYLFQLPLAFGLTAFAVGLLRAQPKMLTWLNVIWMVGLFSVWLPLEPLFYDALGFKMKVANAVRVSLVLTSMVPLVSQLPRDFQGRIAIGAAVGAILALLIGKFNIV